MKTPARRFRMLFPVVFPLLSLIGCTSGPAPETADFSPIPTTLSPSTPFPSPSNTPTRRSTPTPERINPYSGPVPDHASARLGMGGANASAFSPDGRLLVVTGTLGVFAFNTDALDPAWSFLTENEGTFEPVFSPDGGRLAFNAGLDRIVILDSQTGEKITSWNALEAGSDLTGPIRSLSFSPDGTLLAGISANGTFLWNAADGRLLRNLAPMGNSDPCGLDFSPDGKILAGARGDLMTLWNLAVPPVSMDAGDPDPVFLRSGLEMDGAR